MNKKLRMKLVLQLRKNKCNIIKNLIKILFYIALSGSASICMTVSGLIQISFDPDHKPDEKYPV